MSFALRSAWPTDLEAIVAAAVDAQADPERYSCHLGEDAASIRADLVDIDGSDSWVDATTVALDDERRLIGWIAAELDADMGRAWWWGPFLADPVGPLSDAIADGLFATAVAGLENFSEHELAIDSRSDFLHRFGDRNGFAIDDASVALRSGAAVDVSGVVGATVMPLAAEHEQQVMTLHDELFPGTHTPGALLVASTDADHDRFVAVAGTDVVGYVATEMQNDGSLYIDFLGTRADQRRRGVGRALITTAMQKRADAAYAHLTVGVTNSQARALYASLGFDEERVLVPLRRGFGSA